MEPLASYGNSKTTSNTNVSTTISLSIFDQYGNEVPVQADSNNPIQIIIPRDPNLVLPDMILQNVTSLNQSFYYKFIDLKQIQFNDNLSIVLLTKPFSNCSGVKYIKLFASISIQSE